MTDVVKELHANIKRLGEKIVFAHEVNVEDAIKVIKVDEKKSRKEGILIMNFFDYPHAIPVARIALSPSTAKVLGGMLSDISKRMDKELDSKELKMVECKKPETTTEHKSYLG
jgi:hypothetical protein